MTAVDLQKKIVPEKVLAVIFSGRKELLFLLARGGGCYCVASIVAAIGFDASLYMKVAIAISFWFYNLLKRKTTF